jgi:translation initiation factor IF-2
VLVQNGTLERGDTIIAGKAYGRIKAMFDETGAAVASASPSTPVIVMGLGEMPEPGDTFEAAKNEKEARQTISDREVEAEDGTSTRTPVSLEALFAQIASGQAKELNLILKTDFQGTLQPIVSSLDSLSKNNPEGIKINILAADTGNISENDVMLASASGAIIMGFSVDIDNAARRSADSQHVDVRVYNIIYKLLEDVELALHGMLEPKYADKLIGSAEVRQVFKISKVGTIAGSYVRDGIIRRNSKARVLRNEQVLVASAPIGSLKRLNEDVREVRAGFECGISLDGFESFQEGDIIEFYVTERVN